MLNYAQNYGEFLTITIENMSEEHHNIEHGNVATDMASNIERGKAAKKEERPWTDFGVIAVSSGEGLDEMFKELGVDIIVSGGQTMNPSTEDFVKAVNELHAHNVYILPNNGNIVMAANQAAEVIDIKDVKVNVIPSKTIPQGIASLMQYSTEMSAEEIYESMKEALGMIKSGSVTYAIKDTDINGVHVTKDYYMGMKEDKEIVTCVKDKLEALKSLVDALVDEDSFALSIYVGKDCSEEEEKEVADFMAKTYPNLEVNVRNGGQPVYSFLVGVE
jgi:dihydroxyacetone kinase-like predicted kinase